MTAATVLSLKESSGKLGAQFFLHQSDKCLSDIRRLYMVSFVLGRSIVTRGIGVSA